VALRARYSTICRDLSAGGFVVVTTAELWQGELLVKTASISDTTEDPFFAKMVDRWARVRGVDWMARHIIEVQRKFAYDVAVAGKRLS
jgi:hypothetical protein